MALHALLKAHYSHYDKAKVIVRKAFMQNKHLPVTLEVFPFFLIAGSSRDYDQEWELPTFEFCERCVF